MKAETIQKSNQTCTDLRQINKKPCGEGVLVIRLWLQSVDMFVWVLMRSLILDNALGPLLDRARFSFHFVRYSVIIKQGFFRSEKRKKILTKTMNPNGELAIITTKISEQTTRHISLSNYISLIWVLWVIDALDLNKVIGYKLTISSTSLFSRITQIWNLINYSYIDQYGIMSIEPHFREPSKYL